ncbi:MAG: histidine--tRNA ligase [Actinobacteria bacterium]|nr:histidine--tRNA ligase [Actinomycetota bacterium]
MDPKYSAPRGTADLIYPDSEKTRQLISIACEVFEQSGYQLISTPVLESTGLFVRSIGKNTDIVNKEMYTFEDQGGQLLALRPEGTAPVIRAYLERGLQSGGLPCKLYYYGPMFRRERPQAGRYRQFNQAGAELIGSPDPMADTEIISLSSDLFRRLELENYVLKINSVGCRECREDYVADLRKKLEEVSPDLCEQCRKRAVQNPMRVFDCKNAKCITVLENAPSISTYLCESCIEHYHTVLLGLEILGIDHVQDDRLVRGLDYYTRTAFEFQFEGLGAQNTVSAGGRYDYLVEELGGPPTGGVGFSIGVERLMLAVEAAREDPFKLCSIEVFVAGIDIPGVEILKALQLIREGGISAEMDLMDRSLKAQMKHANRLGVKYVIIAGGEEHQRGEVTLRDLEKSEQWTLGINDAISLINEKKKEQNT